MSTMTCEQAVRQLFMYLDRAQASDACLAFCGQLAFSRQTTRAPGIPRGTTPGARASVYRR